MNCGGAIYHYHGSVIGTITSPACGGTSNNLTLYFGTTNGVQAHTTYTGATKVLTVTKTPEGTGQGALTQEATLTSLTAGTLTCT